MSLRASRWCRWLRICGLACFGLLTSISAAYAANIIKIEEHARKWIVAIITIGGGAGWIWHRTFNAADVYEIWYGTNRRDKVADTYDNDFGDRIHFGRCRVSIPRGHVFGSIGSSRLRRWAQRLVSGTDDQLKVIKIIPLSPNEFERNIRARLAKFDPNEKTVLIFIHGYNVKFTDAVIRAAQIGFDLKIPGVMALYSWPSKADVGAYLSDADSIAASETHIVEFISRISKAAGTAKINIIAHSMGNLGLVRALTAGFADRRLEQIKFGQIFLAAPDIDVNLFKQLADVYCHCSERTTLYISAVDRALLSSRWVHANQRTGYSPPVTVIDGIDTVEATNIDIGLLGHNYYAASAPILHDMAMLVRNDLPPNKRPGLFSAQGNDGKYWVIRE
jgi:esterase/lipase superfamily enzyme